VKTLHVTFPVLRGARRFHIEKGRRWSFIEHVLLDAIWKKAASAADLAAASGLPRRVVVEAFVRLMRAGWVEMAVSADGLIFNATDLGATVVGRDQLPAATRVEPGYRGFAIEQITGGVFRSRGLDLRPQDRLPVSNDDQIVVHLTASEAFEGGDLSEVFTVIEGEDELIVGVDRSSRKLVDRYAVVTVRETLIEGLPNRASTMLKALIHAKALEAIAAESRDKGQPVPKIPAVPKLAELSEYEVLKPALYEHDDLVVDGDSHKDVLERTIKRATERVIIHSTFVTDRRAHRRPLADWKRR
jgi:cardiolipin synthase A/B